MSNGNPALAGSPPTDPNALANNHGQSGPTENHSGANAGTGGDLHAEGGNFYAEAKKLIWRRTKGAKLEYGWGARFDIVLGIKNSVVAGLRSAIDLAHNRTYNLSSYTTLFGGIRYEVIRPKKVEIISGTKTDEPLGGFKREKVEGVWMHSEAGKQQENERLFQEVVDELLKESGTKWERVIKAYEAKWKKVEAHAKSLTEKCDTELQQKIVQMNVTMKDYKADIDKIDDICKQFELKSKDLDIAADSALSVKTSKKTIKGAKVSMKAGTMKFMGDLVKLGE